jgi:hypothetical protein
VTGLGLGAATASQAFAEAQAQTTEQRTTLYVVGQTIQLEPSARNPDLHSEQVRFWVRGPTPQTISVTLTDVVFTDKGEKITFPLGSTGHTLQDIVHVGEYPREHDPSGPRLSHRIEVQAVQEVAEVRYGLLEISITPAKSAPSGVSVTAVSAVTLIVVVVPEGFDGVLPVGSDAGLMSSTVMVRELSPQNLFEMVLPDIPGVINRGPVEVSREVTNGSQIPYFVSTRWDLSSRAENLLGSSGQRALLFPDQVKRDAIDSVVVAEGATRPLNVVPGFGLVSVTVSTEATLGSSVLGAVEDSRTFLVLRWKEPTAVIVALLIVIFLLVRTRRKSDTNDDETPGQDAGLSTPQDSADASRIVNAAS